MPSMDGTGPMGQGPMTGRSLGPCGRGMRGSYGFGCGCGYGFRRFISPKNEMSALENEEQMLLEELEAIREEKKALQEQK